MFEEWWQQSKPYFIGFLILIFIITLIEGISLKPLGNIAMLLITFKVMGFAVAQMDKSDS